MGEYAIRKSDGAEIKIGTCESMYYLRYEDRFKVKHLAGNVDPATQANLLRFRLPFPDEDNIAPGEYEDYSRGQRLYGTEGLYKNSEFAPEGIAEEPGVMQLTHPSGLLLNVPCYHGVKLPEVTAPMKAFWNGKSWSLELCWLRPTEDGVKPVVRCRHCDMAWRFDWSDIWNYVPGAELRAALRIYAEAEQKAA